MAIVRRAQLDDQVGIHDSHMGSIREICVHDHGEEEIKGWGYRQMRSKEQWLQTLDNQNKFVWVVEHEKEIEGHCFISLVPEESKADIHCLYLVSSHLDIHTSPVLHNFNPRGVLRRRDGWRGGR